MNAAKFAVKVLAPVAFALAIATNPAAAAHGPHGGAVKSPFDSLGGIGGTNTNRAPATILGSAESNLPSPFDALGGIGGRDTNRAPAGQTA